MPGMKKDKVKKPMKMKQMRNGMETKKTKKMMGGMKTTTRSITMPRVGESGPKKGPLPPKPKPSKGPKGPKHPKIQKMSAGLKTSVGKKNFERKGMSNGGGTKVENFQDYVTRTFGKM